MAWISGLKLKGGSVALCSSDKSPSFSGQPLGTDFTSSHIVFGFDIGEELKKGNHTLVWELTNGNKFTFTFSDVRTLAPNYHYGNVRVDYGTEFYDTVVGNFYTNQYASAVDQNTMICGFGIWNNYPCFLRFTKQAVGWGLQYVLQIFYPSHELPSGYLEGSIYNPDDYKDPYEKEGSPSTTGGGGSVFKNSVTINIPPVPTVSVTDTGFVSLYNPSENDLKQLASLMWSTDFFDNILKMWANPMDCILGLSLFPVQVPSSSGSYVKVGNVQLDVPMNKVSTQYVDLNCGSLSFTKENYNFLDYSPYSKVSLFLPYCGVFAIDSDEVMGKDLNVYYRIDLWSGSCVAYLSVNGSVLHQYTGNCAYNIPITSSNYGGLITNIAHATATIGGAVGSGGLSGIGKGIMAVADTVLSSKPTIENNVNFGGNTGMLSVRTPVLLLEFPNYCLPSNANHYVGYPLYKKVDSISELEGYTEFSTVYIKSENATESEVNEIESLLKEGVFL